MKTFTQKFDNALDAVQAILMSILTKIGPFFVALMPALFTAYAIFHTFKSDAGPQLAFFFAVVVGLAMETVGIVATHTALDLYNAKEEGKIQPVKFQLMTWLVPVYVVGVALVVGFSGDAFTPLVKGLGVASPFLTTIVYVAVALARDISRTEAKQEAIEDRQAQIEAEQREWERQKERMELELKHAEKLARIEAKQPKTSVKEDVNETVKNTVKYNALDAVNLSKEERKRQHFDSLLNIYLNSPKAGVSLVAGKLGVSRQTIYNYLDELETAGKIHRNGQGVEVIG